MDADADVLVIGAGPAGLAAAACLTQRGRAPLLIEAERIGAAWHAHYERLHLHTVKELSALPGLPFPADAPRYVPRRGVLDYLAAYAAHFGLQPRLGEAALAMRRHPDGRRWLATTSRGRIAAGAVVVATGANHAPVLPELPGSDAFGGRVLHSRDYREPAPFAGQRVLVVGMGNTGAEIALDLAEHGVPTTLSVRSPVNIVHRDVLGRPTQKTSIALGRLPPRWGDALARVLRDLTVGDLSRHGLRTPAISPLRQLRELGRTPVIDVGTLARIRAGDIAVRPGIERLTASGARFVDGSEAAFDAMVLATGYRPDVQRLFPDHALPLDEHGLPTELIGRGERAGLAFVGFDLRQPGGLLRTIGQQAQAVAAALA